MSESCSKIKASIVFTFALIFFMWSGVVYLKKLSFEETKCDIKNVTYTQSMGDIDNLVSCKCGRRNKCLMGTCITIKGGIYGTNQYWKFLPDTDSNIPADMVKCTFSEDRCYDFDKVDNRKRQLESNKKRAETYIQLQKSNTPTTCYHRNGDTILYLKNTDRSLEFYISCGFLVVSILIMGCCFCPCSKSVESSTSKVEFI